MIKLKKLAIVSALCGLVLIVVVSFVKFAYAETGTMDSSEEINTLSLYKEYMINNNVKSHSTIIHLVNGELVYSTVYEFN